VRHTSYVYLAALVVTACSTTGGGSPAGGDAADTGARQDASRDAAARKRDGATDAGRADAAHDATRHDGGVDATLDSGADATHDAPTDSAIDVSHEAAPADALADAAPDGLVDSGRDVNVTPVDGSVVDPCLLPGTVQFTMSGKTTVAGGSPSDPSLAFLTLPPGFCAHYFGTVPDARQIRFAPGGELFVASPTMISTGGDPTGALNAIVILPDDNLDGVADSRLTFLSFPAPSTTQGMLFTPGYFYYQDGTSPGTIINRVAYAAGERTPSGASEQVANLNAYTSSVHWPKAMDLADDGTIYVGNGGDQGESCVFPHPVHGAVYKIDPAPGGGHPNGQEVAQGLRNPISIKCRAGHNTCFGLELAKDYSAGTGGREKMFPIHAGDDWGFPCCATTNLPYQGSPSGTDCSGVVSDTNSFMIGDTPFSLEFEPGNWPGVWAGRAYVVTHGQAGSWKGARMVAIPMDASTGLPMASTDTDGGDVGMLDFATGWDDETLSHGRPAALAFSRDGRLFVANDNNGVIFWIAPMTPQ
jgi:glucose/arabinose dehydrogenase